MSVNTWEEFCQYTWVNGGITLYTEVEGNILYYYLVNETPPIRHRWFDISHHSPYFLTNSWTKVGDSPLYNSLLTQQEKVCKKIALMETRWLNYQARKQNAG